MCRRRKRGVTFREPTERSNSCSTFQSAPLQPQGSTRFVFPGPPMHRCSKLSRRPFTERLNAWQPVEACSKVRFATRASWRVAGERGEHSDLAKACDLNKGADRIKQRSCRPRAGRAGVPRVCSDVDGDDRRKLSLGSHAPDCGDGERLPTLRRESLPRRHPRCRWILRPLATPTIDKHKFDL